MFALKTVEIVIVYNYYWLLEAVLMACKLLVWNKFTWNYISVFANKLLLKRNSVTLNNIIVDKLLVLDKNTWKHTTVNKQMIIDN